MVWIPLSRVKKNVAPRSELRLRPDAPAVALDDALHDRQADAGAFIFLRAVQPLEDAEELVGVAHVETGAVVADEINVDAVWASSSRSRSRRRLALAGVFQRIGEQVEPDLLQQHGVALSTAGNSPIRISICRSGQGSSKFRRARCAQAGRCRRSVCSVPGGSAARTSARSSISAPIRCAPSRMVCRLALAFGGQLRPEIFQHGLGKSVHRAQRRAQIV